MSQEWLKLLFLALVTITSAEYPARQIKEFSAGSASVEQKTFRDLEPKFRLPNTVLPVHYDLKIRPILDNYPDDQPQWSAPGSVNILVNCVQNTTNITLHSEVNINTDLVKVTKLSTNTDVEIVNHSFDTEKTFYIISFTETLQVGQEYSIFIDYVAQVKTDSLEGLYRSHYDDPITGETKYLAATQFQAFAARRAFPCFDEPALKATFKTTLGRRSNYTALCNTPVVNTTPIPGLNEWFWDEFNTTVPMPTYLVAIVISDLSYTEASPSIYSKPVRTYGPKYLMDNGYGEVPSTIAANVLYFFEQFFQVEYALHKMDSVGLQDFAAGAMENWGLNIYRDYMLLYSPTQNNEKERRSVALTLNHELAHQWSGNLVTCDWWTMAWLNEGFATYLSYQGMQYTNPEFNPQKAIQNDCVFTAFRNDVLENAHPTVLPDKGNPWETMSYNANLVYSKGAALLRMMEGFLTLETLQKGLQTYMKQYSFQATNQDQLFEILTQQSIQDDRLPVGITVKNIMDTWTLQKGFPLVKVAASGNDKLVTVSQEDYRPDNETRVYFIPVAIGTQSKPNLGSTIPQYWLDQRSQDLAITLQNESEWIVVNSGSTGYYRVQYDDILTERIQSQLNVNHMTIRSESRNQFIDDYFTMAWDGKISIESALGFTKYLAKELEESVWNSWFYHFRLPGSLLFQSNEYSDIFKNYIQPRVSVVLEAVKNSGNDLTVGATNLFYADLMTWSCTFTDSECETEALNYYSEWNKAPATNPIPPLLRPSIYCSAVRADGTNRIENFLFTMDRFIQESNSGSKDQLLTALGCTVNTEAANLLLATMILETSIPNANVPAAVSSVARNRNLRLHMMTFLDEQIDASITFFGDAKLIANAITSMCSHMSSQQELDWVNGFIEKHADKLTDPEVTRILNGAVTILQGNMEWMQKFGIPMGKWFSEN